MKKNITYRSSGVDIDMANRFVDFIQKDVKGTLSSKVIKKSGSFGALYSFDKKEFKDPVLVSSTDGVGTKLLIAQALGIHDTVGIDLVAMNVNDILCTGAKPLFFLDYIACGKVDIKTLNGVMKGIVKGCKLSSCSLVGGETAEMPCMYKPNEYDLAGFAVGVVDKKKMIDGTKIKAGDCLIGLSSSGFHSNGYSLVRKVFSQKEIKENAREILKPTRIYVNEVHKIIEKFPVKGMAHITGGAFFEKLTKVLPKGKCFQIQRGSWPVPFIFQKLQKRGKINDHEMFRTFNMGIGFAIVVDRKVLPQLRKFLKKNRIKHYEIGKVIQHSTKRVLL